MILAIDILTAVSAIYAVIVIALIIKDWRSFMTEIKSVKDGMPEPSDRVLWKTKDGKWLENIDIEDYYNRGITHYVVIGKK